MVDPETLIKKTIERIKNGTLTDFSPLIALFQYERKPMTLDGHFMFLPFFSLEYPKYLTWQCGRQVSKSFTLSETLILTTGMIESFSSLYIAPRYDQLKRFHTQVLSPMLKTPSIRDFLVDRSGSDAIEMKAFLNGNTLMLEHAYSSPDRTRGASGVARVCCDESVRGSTKIAIFHLTDAHNGVYYISDSPEIVPISEVKQGDIVLSFTSDGCIYSPVVRDASYHGRRAIFKVTTQSGRVLECTADHRIHTNLGGMRLSEVVEYACNSRDGAPAGAEGRSQRRCFKRDCRNTVRRRLHIKTGAQRSGQFPYLLESRPETERLSGVQGQYIIRARYPSSVYSAESRLRGLLGKTGNKVLKDVYIACMDGLSYTGLSEDYNFQATGTPDASHRACVVVRRRRKSHRKCKYGQHSHQRFYGTRGGLITAMATRSLGNYNHATSSKALEYGKSCDCAGSTTHGLRTPLRTSAGIPSRVDELQTSAMQACMCTVRQRVLSKEQCNMLLNGMSEPLQNVCETCVLRADQRPVSCEKNIIRGAVSGGAPRGDSTEVAGSVRHDDSGAAGTQSAVWEGVSANTQGATQCETARVTCTKEGRPDVRGEIEGREATLLSAEEGRPCSSPKRSRTSADVTQEARTAREDSVVLAAISCDAPRDIRGAKTTCAGTGDSKETGGDYSTRNRYTGRFVYDRIVSIEYIGEDDVYDIEVVGTHNYTLANGMCSYNCQDINPDFMPVFESTTDASRFGVMQSTGTPKTSDTLLALQFSKSSQCHWTIKCPHCGKWNIADIDEQLIKMIGKNGLSCADCGKLLDPRTGGWLPKFPERMKTHAGYHVPQIILPMHCENETKWRVLRAKQSDWDKARFMNEILGVECDEAVKLLTKEDLERAQTPWENTLESAVRHAREFDTVFVGVDWSGGGGGFSRTAVAVVAKQNYSDETYVLYVSTLPHGLTPEEEADQVSHIFSAVNGYLLAHDYTGAGFVRESVLLGRHPYLRNKIYPFAYVFRTGSQMISYQESGSRRSANVDKTRSLLLTFNAIRSRRLRLPKFNPNNQQEPVFELLNIVERPQEFSKASIKDVYILQRAAGKYDDAAHAINIGYIALCDMTESWPDFSMDPKYEMTPAALQEMTGSLDRAVPTFS